MLQTFPPFLYLLAVGMWLGSRVHFTFFVAMKTFKVFPRIQAGDINTQLFPGYYLFGIICGLAALLGLFLTGAPEKGKFLHYAQWGIIVAMLGMTAYNTVVLRPTVNALWVQIKEVHPEEPAKEVSAAFGKSHGLSMVLGLGTMILGVVAMYLGVWSLRL